MSLKTGIQGAGALIFNMVCIVTILGAAWCIVFLSGVL